MTLQNSPHNLETHFHPTTATYLRTLAMLLLQCLFSASTLFHFFDHDSEITYTQSCKKVSLLRNHKLGGPPEFRLQGVERLLSCGFLCHRERGPYTLPVHYAIN